MLRPKFWSKTISIQPKTVRVSLEARARECPSSKVAVQDYWPKADSKPLITFLHAKSLIKSPCNGIYRSSIKKPRNDLSWPAKSSRSSYGSKGPYEVGSSFTQEGQQKAQAQPTSSIKASSRQRVIETFNSVPRQHTGRQAGLRQALADREISLQAKARPIRVPPQRLSLGRWSRCQPHQDARERGHRQEPQRLV